MTLNYNNACVHSPGLESARCAAGHRQSLTILATYNRYRAGQHAVISHRQEAKDSASLIPRRHGSNAIWQADRPGRARSGSFNEYCWNHTTPRLLWWTIRYNLSASGV